MRDIDDQTVKPSPVRRMARRYLDALTDEDRAGRRSAAAANWERHSILRERGLPVRHPPAGPLPPPRAAVGAGEGTDCSDDQGRRRVGPVAVGQRRGASAACDEASGERGLGEARRYVRVLVGHQFAADERRRANDAGPVRRARGTRQQCRRDARGTAETAGHADHS